RHSPQQREPQNRRIQTRPHRLSQALSGSLVRFGGGIVNGPDIVGAAAGSALKFCPLRSEPACHRQTKRPKVRLLPEGTTLRFHVSLEPSQTKRPSERRKAFLTANLRTSA